MKKTMRLAALAVIALAGCDLMLEKMFPDQVGANRIVVTVTIDEAAFAGWNTDGILAMELVRSTGPSIYEPIPGTLRAATFTQSATPAYGEAAYTYANLPDGAYYLHTWYDANGDGNDNDGVCTNYVDGSGYWSNLGFDPLTVSGGASGSIGFTMN